MDKENVVLMYNEVIFRNTHTHIYTHVLHLLAQRNEGLAERRGSLSGNDLDLETDLAPWFP